MKYIKKILFIFVIFNFYTLSNAQDLVFVDMQKLLNSSKAGKQAQDFLKKKITSENKKFEKEVKALKKEEQDLIAKKKSISAEEYKKNLNSLRQKNINYQKRKRNMNNELLNKKNEARSKLLQALNPIFTKYMSENKVEIILDKKYVIMANTKVDITDQILKILDNQVKSLNLK
tara:strand:+ start:2774 stop:3295 length:522 start_codon:yes stop_codon:yes gene_type:complete